MFHTTPSLVRLTVLALVAPLGARCALPGVEEIIEKSVAANALDFAAAPDFSHKETDRTPGGSKTFQVTMLEGSPYRRLIAVGDEPLSKSAVENEARKFEQAIAKRRSESSSQRQSRVAKYQRERKRNNAMMQQLTKAFSFTLLEQCKLGAFDVYRLRATPRPGYQPPNLETQVLPSMEGELWIDKTSYQWVKVTAKVIRPASIEGFLAQVEPGTQFELEKMPVEGEIWQPKHFSMKSQAKVLFLFSENAQEDDTFFDYARTRR